MALVTSVLNCSTITFGGLSPRNGKACWSATVDGKMYQTMEIRYLSPFQPLSLQ